MVDFKALETLVWVATLQSFHRAAARLNTTQPAVSQRIAQLEAEVGQRLLVREKRQVVPTDAGRRVLDYAERLLKLRAEMLHAVADRSAIRGTLRLGGLLRRVPRLPVEGPERARGADHGRDTPSPLLPSPRRQSSMINSFTQGSKLS